MHYAAMQLVHVSARTTGRVLGPITRGEYRTRRRKRDKIYITITVIFSPSGENRWDDRNRQLPSYQHKTRCSQR